jgi:tripartite-type tricarboxylate transporter receptor subunit TctC
VSKWVKGGAVLVANPSFKPNTLQEMIAFAKDAAEPIQYGAQGQGTFPHYTMEALAKDTGAKLTAVRSADRIIMPGSLAKGMF